MTDARVGREAAVVRHTHDGNLDARVGREAELVRHTWDGNIDARLGRVAILVYVTREVAGWDIVRRERMPYDIL